MKTPAFWQQRGLFASLLTPAAWAYGIGAWLDRRMTTPLRAPLPVISIGNVTAGGAGKTPFALALAPMLQTLGEAPHYVTRGYGASPQQAHAVSADDAWQAVGDEALLLARVAPTWVGRKRLASAQAACAAGASVIVCDDALQHHALYKDVSVLVIDGAYGLGNGRLLPAGPLREPFAAALARCDAVVIIGDDRHGLTARIALPIFKATIEPMLEARNVQGKRFAAFAGIAHPQKFYDTLRALGGEIVATRDFADHHPYSTDDVAALQQWAVAHDAQLITTEKDAVKWPLRARDVLQTLPVMLKLEQPDDFSRWLGARLNTIRRA